MILILIRCTGTSRSGGARLPATRERGGRDGYLDDVPHILSCVAKLAACHGCRETVVADGDLLVDKLIGKIVGSFRHSSNKHADALLVAQSADVFVDSYQWSIEGQGDLPAVWG